jgi:hypothetical protein
MDVLLYVDPERRVHKGVADSMAVLLRIDAWKVQLLLRPF